MLKSSVSKSTHFDKFFTLLWSANHLVELTEHMCMCFCACEREGVVNIKLSSRLLQYTSERLIN